MMNLETVSNCNYCKKSFLHCKTKYIDQKSHYNERDLQSRLTVYKNNPI